MIFNSMIQSLNRSIDAVKVNPNPDIKALNDAIDYMISIAKLQENQIKTMVINFYKENKE